MNDWKKKGWVRLYRSIEDNPFYFLEPFTKSQAWIDLFLNANHTNNIISIRGNIIHLKRGQIGWSEITMSKRWKWSKNRTRRFLKLLETEQQIEQQKDRYITTIITILNYEKYQSDTADDKAERQQKDSRRYIDKNGKKEKNEKNTDFEKFWLVFDKKRSRSKCETIWNSLPPPVKEKALTAAAVYAASTPDKKFRKHPATWLNQECWDDEIDTPSTDKSLKDEYAALGESKFREKYRLIYNEPEAHTLDVAGRKELKHMQITIKARNL